MPYNFYTPYLNTVAKSPKQDWVDDFSAFVDDVFYNSSDWFTIQEETAYGTGTLQEVDARINHVFSPTTGSNMGDDWKILMFADLDKSLTYGQLYYFDSNWWVTINTESVKNLTSTCIVRRCNNTLRWRDSDGAYYEEPCVLDYAIQENRDYASAVSAVVNPSGVLQVISQLNSTTNKIKPNQRFLFGNASNWTAYKVFGGGVNNFDNLVGATNSTNGILKLTMGVNYVNSDTDDLTNGVADVNEFVYTIEIDGALTGQVSNTSQLSARVYLNGNYDSNLGVTWSSDDTDIATVSSTGLVTFVSAGTASVCATLAGNSNIQTCETVTATVAPASEYVIQISPSENFVLESQSETFTATLYLNGVAQADTFSFVLQPNTVPSDNYVYTAIDGNNFKIENVEMFLGDTLDVQCTSGIHVRTFNFTLRGAW